MFYVYEKDHTGKVKTWAARDEAELLSVFAAVPAFQRLEINALSPMTEILEAGRTIYAQFEVMEGIGQVRAAIERGAVCEVGRYQLMCRIRRHLNVNARGRMIAGGPQL